jgi:hypothetical protein
MQDQVPNITGSIMHTRCVCEVKSSTQLLPYIIYLILRHCVGVCCQGALSPSLSMVSAVLSGMYMYPMNT